MRLNAPDSRYPALQRILGRALKADRACFGHAVGDGDFGKMHFGDGTLHHLDRAWRASHDSGPQ
jgi:hypothetical protein